MSENTDLCSIRIALLLVLTGLLFGIAMGIGFGVNEDYFKDYINTGIAANPEVHDQKSAGKIWRYAQRAHFHSTGIAAFSLGLVILVGMSSMRRGMKKTSSILVGLGALYPLSWFSMFILAPAIGRSAAHSHILTELITYVSIIGLLAGLALLLGNLFLGMFKAE